MMAAAQRSQTSLDFCHNPHPASLLQGLQGLRSDSLLVDVTLCVSGRKIPCHRNVLAASSEYFHAMFCNGHRESKEQAVIIHEVSTDTVQLLVDYAYSSKVTITENNATELLEGAIFFQIHPVFDACRKFLSEHLSVKNCLEMVNVGRMLSPDLEKEALLLVMTEFAAVSKTPEFLDVTKDQLITLISSDDLSASEETVYKALMTWINHDTRRRKRGMRELMELVRFPFMDKLFFFENVQINEAMRKCCHDIVTETLKYHVFPEEVRSPRTHPRHVSGFKEAVVIIGGKENLGTEDSPLEHGNLDSITMAWTAEPSVSSWVPLTKMKQNNNCGFAAAVLGTSDIIISGGQASPKEIWLYQPELNSWCKLTHMKYGCFLHRLAVVQGKVYAIGGMDRKSVLTSVEVYDRSLHKWTEGVALPQPRYMHGVAVLDGSIYVIGGLGADIKETSTVYRFTPGDSQWQPQNDMPTNDFDIAATPLNGSIYVLGGSTEILCFTPANDGGSWSTVSNRSVGPSSGMTVYGGKVYICGGCCEDDRGSSEVLCLNPDTKSLDHVGTMHKGLFHIGCVTILKGS